MYSIQKLICWQSQRTRKISSYNSFILIIEEGGGLGMPAKLVTLGIRYAYRALTFSNIFSVNTYTSRSIWLSERKRHEITNFIVQSDFTESQYIFQKNHMKILKPGIPSSHKKPWQAYLVPNMKNAARIPGPTDITISIFGGQKK